MEGHASIGSMIRFSWAKSREILFPFNFKQWFRILVIVWLAGAGIQGFSANFKAPAKPVQPSFVPQKFKMPTLPPAMSSQAMKKMPPASSVEASPASGISGSSAEQVRRAPQKGTAPLSVSQDADRIAKLRASMERPKRGKGPIMLALFIAGMIGLGLGFVALVVFFLWISCRFNFVLLDTLVTRKPVIRASFKSHKEAGNSFFVWALVFTGISLVGVLLAGQAFLISIGIAKWNLAVGIPLVILAGLLALAVLLGIIFLGIMMRDFVVPVMYREKIPAMNALSKFMKAGTFTFGKMFLYLLVVLGLWILAVILQSVVSVLVALGGLIAGAIVAIPGILLIGALPFLKLPLILLGGLVAIALVLAVIVVIGMVMLPAVIFFRVFALAYLTRLYPECDLLSFNHKP